jgi:pyruvate-ferredoxin/flavodoxin oxidoreductase
MLGADEQGAVFLINAPFGPGDVWDHLPRTVQRQIVDKKPQFALPAGTKVPESVPAGLFEHCILEYSNLRVLLPEIYAEMGGAVA